MIKRFAYNDYHIDLVYQFLQNFYRQKINKEYEIRIDGLTVVERTQDLTHFYWFKKYVDEFMTRVSFVFYKGKSRKSDQYILERKVQGGEVFDQSAIDKVVEQQTTAFQKELKFKLLKKKNRQLKKKLKELKEENTILASKQQNGMQEAMGMFRSYLQGNSNKTDDLNGDIGGLPLSKLLDFVKSKQKEWGDDVLARAIGVAMVIGDDVEILEKVEEFIQKTERDEEEE